MPLFTFITIQEIKNNELIQKETKQIHNKLVLGAAIQPSCSTI